MEPRAERLDVRDGETVRFSVTVSNPHDVPVVRRFPTGCQFGFRIERIGKVAARAPRMCTQAPTELVLQPGEALVREFEWTWDRATVPAGSYDLYVGPGRNGSGPPLPLLLRADPLPEDAAPD